MSRPPAARPRKRTGSTQRRSALSAGGARRPPQRTKPRPQARTSTRTPAQRPPAKRKIYRSRSPRRLVSLFVILILGFGAMTMRLVNLQIIDGSAYAEQAAAQRSRSELIPARRGAIFDRGGEPLAISVDLQTLWTDPSQVEDPAGTAARLAPILGRDPRSDQRVSSESTATPMRWRRVGPTSPRIRSVFGSSVTNSRTSHPYWNDSGLRRFEESFSTLVFPHPNWMKRAAASASGTRDL